MQPLMQKMSAVLSFHGIGAYDHVPRSAMLEWLIRVPRARATLPFVRPSNATPSTYSWWDETGERHAVSQAEGREQGRSADAASRAHCGHHGKRVGNPALSWTTSTCCASLTE